MQGMTKTIHFANLSTLCLPHNEVIKLSEVQPIPTLTYRLIYNSVPQDNFNKLNSLIF